jgi:hypothetical protein
MTGKDDLHRLVDELPEGELHAARRYLEFLKGLSEDPLLEALENAPWDDEPETPEEAAAVEEARKEYRKGKGRPWEEVREELGRG